MTGKHPYKALLDHHRLCNYFDSAALRESAKSFNKSFLSGYLAFSRRGFQRLGFFFDPESGQ